MPDAEAPTLGIRPEAERPDWQYMSLTGTALERARHKLNVNNNDDLAAALGFANSMTLWRACQGRHNTPLDQAVKIAELLGMEITDAFAMPEHTRPIRRDPKTRKLSTRRPE